MNERRWERVTCERRSVGSRVHQGKNLEGWSRRERVPSWIKVLITSEDISFEPEARK